MKNRIVIAFILIVVISMFIACAEQAEKPSKEFEEVIDTGILSVESSPTEANVYIDNELKGQTPLTLYNFPSGAHSVAVKKEGYADFEKNVNVKVGLTEQVDARLSPLKAASPEAGTAEAKPEEGQKEQQPSQPNKIILSSFSMYHDFENKLFTSTRAEKSDVFSRKYDKYMQFTAVTPAKIKVINVPLKDVSRADCTGAGGVGQLNSGQTLCVITAEGNYFAVSGTWDKMPAELEFVQLS